MKHLKPETIEKKLKGTKIHGAKYFTTRQSVENYRGTCYFDPFRMVATSYGWWRFIQLKDGKLIFNNYSYSSETSKHQRQALDVLAILGIKVDHFVYFPTGLPGNGEFTGFSMLVGGEYSHKTVVQDAIEYAARRKASAMERLANPRVRKGKKLHATEIKHWNAQLELIEKLFGAKLSKKRFKEIQSKVEKHRLADLERKRIKSAERRKERKEREAMITSASDGKVRPDNVIPLFERSAS